MNFHDLLDGREHCRGADLAMFFPRSGSLEAARDAKRICAGCPLRKPCLAYALHHQLAGIWGGTTQRERRRMQKARGITPIPVRALPEFTGARRNRFGG